MSRNRSIELQANVQALVGNIYSICYNRNIHMFLYIFHLSCFCNYQVTSTLCDILSSFLYSKNSSYSFMFFKIKKIKLKLKTRIFEWWSGISFFHIWFVIIWTIVIGDKSQEKWKMICLSPAHSFNGGHWVRLLSLAPVTWPCSCRLLGSCCNVV